MMDDSSNGFRIVDRSGKAEDSISCKVPRHYVLYTYAIIIILNLRYNWTLNILYFLPPCLRPGFPTCCLKVLSFNPQICTPSYSFELEQNQAE